MLNSSTPEAGGFSIGGSLSFGGGQGVTGTVAAGAGSSPALTPCAGGNCPGSNGNFVFIVLIVAVVIIALR